MIETLENGNIYYQNGNQVWGPIEVTPNQFLVHLPGCAHTSKFPKTEQGLRAAITDAREIKFSEDPDLRYFKDNPKAILNPLFRLDSGYVCA